jgi:hypothetical protein
MRDRPSSPRTAVARRIEGVRRDPVRTAVADADWIGSALIERLAGASGAERAVGRYRGLLYRGSRVHCPLCDGRFRYFKPDHNRPDAICPGCMSQERHRALWLYLSAHPELLEGVGSLLHFAPERPIAQRLSSRPGLRYVSADLDSPHAMDRVDIASMPYADESFDAILCSHVLEHVPDDRRAMREMRRVLTPGGWALVMVPLDHARATTLEDPAITSPEQRRAAYLQEDHVRLYGSDLPARLDEQGFETAVIAYTRELPAAARARHGLRAEDDFYLARKPPG